MKQAPDPVSDLNLQYNVPLPAPAYFRHVAPRTIEQEQFIVESRGEIEAILRRESDRFLVILGPCSIHDPKAGIEYAERLAKLREEVGDKLELVMRVYFEKPRTNVGWKGLVMDPDMDGTADLAKGLEIARELLQKIVDLGVPTATEFLDPITPQYIGDLISWAAIGARTVESQTHRQMASGLSMPVGLKNATSGGIIAVVNALKAAIEPQTFFGISDEGVASMVSTKGNPMVHMVLRGGDDGPNFSADHVNAARELLNKGDVPNSIMIDASHANCAKNIKIMADVFENVVEQRANGDLDVIGAMLESNLVAGNQSVSADFDSLTYGQSVTDPCIDWDTTERIIHAAANRLA